jgi:hypothetical protein
VNVPDLFLWQYKQAQRATLATKVATATLGQDDDSGDDDDDADADSDDDTGLDYGVTVPDTGIDLETPEEELGIAPDTSLLNADITQTQSEAMDNVTSALQATGSSAAPSSSAVASGMVTAVGNALSTPQAVASLASAALVYFAGNSTPAMADVFATQAATLASGQPAQALTTVTGADGTASPAQVSTAADGSQTTTPLTAAQLAALTPSAFTVFFAQYGVYLGIGTGLAIFLVLIARGSHHHYRR